MCKNLINNVGYDKNVFSNTVKRTFWREEK